MKIKEKAYNTFMLCLYLNSFLISAFFSKFMFKLPMQIISFFLSIFIGILSIKLDIIFLLSSFFIVIISIDIFNLYNYIQLDELMITYIKIIIRIIVAIYFCKIKISINLLNKYIKYFFFFSFFISIYLIVDKNLYSKLKLNYMSWGYSCLMITLIAAYLFNIFLEYKYLFITLVLNIMLLLYGSRFNFLIGILGSSFFLYFSTNKIIKKFYLIGSIFLAFIFFNLKKILEFIIETLGSYNISTLSIERLYFTLIDINTEYGIIGVRKIWYDETLKLIKNFPIFGTGIVGWVNKIPTKLYNGDGTFYPHNIFLEILLHFGIIGLIVFIIIIFIVIKKIHIERKKGYKIDNIYFIFIILSLKLLLSSSYLFETCFWFAIFMPFNKSYYHKIIKKHNIYRSAGKNLD